MLSVFLDITKLRRAFNDATALKDSDWVQFGVNLTFSCHGNSSLSGSKVTERAETTNKPQRLTLMNRFPVFVRRAGASAGADGGAEGPDGGRHGGSAQGDVGHHLRRRLRLEDL